ncbi:hypothetical protein HBA54_05125 [Pelagibius litoralis]|uniref:Copper resistance protein D domain-containing protein n=1 Tax=Pelagibius litoralis TaxID=374515 RepID=A0A967EWR4_9PROT|nr:CopD family protein [Pelagibius litoralis]NIA67968.1 hypothetical protein [Pelagibius litoralis]
MPDFALSPVEGLSLAAKILSYAFALAAVGTLAFIDAFRGFLLDPEVATLKRHLTVLVAVALLASLAGLFATVALLNGLGLAGGFDAELWSLVAGTAAGDAVWVRLLGLAVLLPGLVFARLRLPAAVLGGLAVAASFGFVGHVQDDQHSFLLHALLMLHLLAIAFWIGSLWPLWRLAAAPDRERVAAVMERFGRLGVYFVACLLAAGIVLTWLLLDGFLPLFTTSYGLMLLAKLALVGGLLLLAALNKWRLVPVLAAADAGAGVRLRLSITAEICLVAAILSVTALLTSAFSLA